MGKPVIAPAVAPVLEVLREDETGVLIPPGDANSMARQICRLAADSELRARLGTAGRGYVLASHTWDRNAQSVLQAYADCGRAHRLVRGSLTDA
jgi:glycosyltransferase involved in cell wall biosynthesis